MITKYSANTNECYVDIKYIAVITVLNNSALLYSYQINLFLNKVFFFFLK